MARDLLLCTAKIGTSAGSNRVASGVDWHNESCMAIWRRRGRPDPGLQRGSGNFGTTKGKQLLMANRPDHPDEIDLERDTVPIRGGDPDLETADSLAEPANDPSATTDQGNGMSSSSAPGSASGSDRGGGTGVDGGKQVSFERGGSWHWPLINLLGLLVVLAINFLANWIPFNNQTTGEVLTKNPIFFQPAGWAFIIWGVIYALLLVFVIYSLLPGGRRSRRVRRIGPVFLVANIANAVWLFFWHWEQFLLSVIAMGILLLSLIVIYILSRRADGDGRVPTRTQQFAIQIPFSLYLGWISVASIANVSVWLDRRGWDGGPFSPQVWSVIMILVGVALAAVIALFRQDAVFPLVFVWSYIAITQQQWSDSKFVAIFAAIGAVIAAALTVAAFMLSFDRRAMSGLYSKNPRKDPLPLE